MDENEAQDIGSTDRPGSSEARQFLSRLSTAFGVGGVLVVQKRAPGPEGADLAPGSVLHWPRYACGSVKCPDSQVSPHVLPPGRGGGGQSWPRSVEQEGAVMLNGSDLYALDIDSASFVQACGGPCTEGCVTLARIGDNAWALGDSKRPDAQPLRFTTEELDAAGIDPTRFGLDV